MKQYIPIIGMEVHVELATNAKMFCSCPADHFQIEPNTQVCPVCLGLPGALPVPNARAVEDTVKIGLALGCQINSHSKFDRKHYFYPDLPKGYQISQYDQPLCLGGAVTLNNGRKIRITRVHLEEDTGKLQHKNDQTLVDYNRSGVPLVEIVTEPDITSAEEAKEYLKLIHSTVRFLGVADADMEKGSMRLEANISVSVDGSLPGYKVEVKNVNSFRYIAAAIEFEVKRQTKILNRNQIPPQETRGWSLAARGTVSQRSKETAKDYRYFPEPDIPRLEISHQQISLWRQQLPLLPQQVYAGLTRLGVRNDYAQVAAQDSNLAAYCLSLAKLVTADKLDVDQLVGLVINAKLNWHKLSPKQIIDHVRVQTELKKLSETETQTLIDRTISDNSKVVTDYRGGKLNALQFLLGQVMALSHGQADPALTVKLLHQALDKPLH